MKLKFIITLSFIWIICAPIYVSIDYAKSDHIDYEDLKSDAYIWAHTSLGRSYLVLGGSYLDEFNGEASFMFNTWDETFTHIHINSAKTIVNEKHYDISLSSQEFVFGLGSFSRGGKMNRTARMFFSMPLLKSADTPKVFEIEISGYVYDHNDLRKPFIYKSKIRKTNKNFTIPLFQHLFYQLTIT